MRRGAKPVKAKGVAKHAVSGKSRKREGSRVGDLEKRLAEALGQLQTRDRELVEAQEQQTAASEILRVISGSPTNTQPVFEAIAQSAVRLCGSLFSAVYTFTDGLMWLVAHRNFSPDAVKAMEALYPTWPGAQPGRETAAGRAILDRTIIEIPDVLIDPEYGRDLQSSGGWRSTFAVPMLRQGAPIGAIAVGWAEPGPASPGSIALLQTFADQAVIAIENARLFKETKDALEQQTATAEILRVISRSPTGVQPTFEAIARAATSLCGADLSGLYPFDGALIHFGAQHGRTPDEVDAARQAFPQPPSRLSVTARAILAAAIVQVADVSEDPEIADPLRIYRTVLSVPMLRDDRPVGAITVARRVMRPFSHKQIALLQAFADQAVIAIENVRLFTELQEKNRALTQAHAQMTEALEQQTATSEILGVISRAPTEVEPVFYAIVTSAARLCEANDVAMLLVEGEDLRAVAGVGPLYASLPSNLRIRLTRDSAATRAVVDRATVHIHDFAAESEAEYPVGRELARRFGHRSMLAVPLLREGVPIGVICAFRFEVRPFPEQQVALLRTFADQAVIAIENVRLFEELEARNRELTESLEQQTATSEILRVISRSPTDVQPVLDAVAANAARLCGATDAIIMRVEGHDMRRVAHSGPIPLRLPAVRPITRDSTAGHAILECRPVHVHDILATDMAREYPDVARYAGAVWRTTLAVPLVRDGVAIGAITIRRTEVRPFTDKQIALLQTFADQAVIAIENVRLFTELQEKNQALTTALDQQTATAQILRAISQAQTDLQLVFEVIADSSMRLLGAWSAIVFRYDGEFLRLVAARGGRPGSSEAMMERLQTPQPPDERTLPGLVVRTRTAQQIVDVEADSAWAGLRESARSRGWRSTVHVPMLLGGEVVGTIGVTRAEPAVYATSEITLLQTFADQAVIAIENARLFQELESRNRDLTESLEQQTATSEILRVISNSPTNIQPVLDTLAETAARLCKAYDVSIRRVDGDVLRLAAHHGPIPQAVDVIPVIRGTTGGRSVLDRQTIHIADAQAETHEFPEGSALARQLGHRTILTVPLLREGLAIGTINLRRVEVLPFTDKQITLLQTFADQAVIAIENVRLFTELQEKNRALTEAHAQVTEALEQQTATSEILRAIAHTQTDVQPVFDTIVRSAAGLCHATTAAVFLSDGRMLYHPANYGGSPAALAAARARYPRALDMETVPGMAVLTRSVVHVPDIDEQPVIEVVREIGRGLGFRSIVAVPMVREGEAFGAILVTRRKPGRFSDGEVELLKTFADQAVIAVENVRLFKELEARTAALTRSVDQLTALGEVGRAVSSTLDLETVLTTIVSRAVQLSGLDGGVVFEYDEGAEAFVQRAATETGGALAEVRRTTRIRKGEGALGRTAITLEPVQVPDITVPGAYESRLRDNLIESGIRAILAVPMVYEGRLIGCLGVTRNRPGGFPAETIDLLRTFATQSALAIQNARLFEEIADKSRQLEAASRHKSEFLTNMSHELRTPLNAVIGFSEVLLQRMFGELNAKQDEYLKDIYASGQHLLSLINDILDLSKIEAGRMELAPAPFHLPTALENAVILVKERAARHGITLALDLDPRLGELVGDERKVKQVLLNLLSNAVKFTPEGGRISLKASRTDSAVEIAVTDTGIGIAPEDQAAIFEEFRQVGSDESRKQEGTGLGLTLAKKFIELHGGRIWVESELGRGSTFTFTLPVS